MTKTVKKAIIELGKDRGNFLPLSDQVPKELFKLAEKPIIEILVEEAVSVGAEKILLLADEKDERLINYFKDLDKKEDYLKKRGNPRAKVLREMQKKFDGLKFSFVEDFEEATRGAEDFAYISSKELVKANKSSLSQLMNVFKTSERPVVGLAETDYGEVEVEKIARGLFKLKSFTDESTFSMIGRAIFTSESRKFFEGANRLKDAIENMIDRGHTTYGTKLSGVKFSIEEELDYLKANTHYSLTGKNSKELEEYINQEDLL